MANIPKFFGKKEDSHGVPEFYRRNDQKEKEVIVEPRFHQRHDEPTSLEKDIFDQAYVLEADSSEPERTVESSVPKNPVRKCADCKKPPQMQCLHCSKNVCMECAQKHVALASEQIDVAQHVLNDKMSIIDRLSGAAKERVNADRNRIIKQADIERDQALVQIDQIAEQQKKQIRDKSGQLTELSLDEVPSFIQRMTSEMEYVNEANNRLFLINSTLPKIRVQQQ